ncbi:MAG: TetR/AcrR family transcriptional regulator [Candidatus Methanoperedens sp.]|nr:TetR/AcrR family transcriptional regulator [Candidatus Methanoperedens sp.]
MDETEQKILDAALSVLVSKGYEGTTTRRIAEAAGVNEVTLFRKFQSKENILREVIIRNLNSALALIDSMFQMETEADQAVSLRNMGLDFIKLMSERIDLISILIEEGRRKPEVQEILSPATQILIKRLSECFELQIKNGKMRNIDPKVAAVTFISFTFYICLMKKFLEGIIGDKEEALEGFVDIFTKGIIKVNDKNLR